MSELIFTSNRAESPFNQIRHIDENGKEFWYARELMPLLGYTNWERVPNVIDRASLSCQNSGNSVCDHFSEETRKTSGRPQQEFKLSRYACYLVAMNGDPRKEEIAQAQTYFAVKTHEAENSEPTSSSVIDLIQQGHQVQGLIIQEVKQQGIVQKEHQAKIAKLEERQADLEECQENLYLRLKRFLDGSFTYIPKFLLDDVVRVEQQYEKSQKEVELLKDRLNAIESKEIEADRYFHSLDPSTLTPQPELTPRDIVRRNVSKFCEKFKLERSEVYSRLYRDYRDIYHYDVKARCCDKNVSYLEQIERDGRINEFLDFVRYKLWNVWSFFCRRERVESEKIRQQECS